MTRKRSLALTILVIIILALECCGVLVDKQPIDPENHTLGDSLFLFMYSDYLLPSMSGFLCGVFEIVDRPVFEGKKGVLRVILAYLRLTLALIFNMVFWAAYTRSRIPLPDRIEHFLKNGFMSGIIIFTITFAIGSAAFPGKPRAESEITPEVRAARRRQIIAFLANAAIFTAIGIWADYLNHQATRPAVNVFSVKLFIAPVILGVSWGIFENIARPVLSRKNGVIGIILPFARAAIVQWMMLSGFDLVITVNLISFPIGSFIMTTVIGLAAFLITCAVFACPPAFVGKGAGSEAGQRKES